jgi:hypothetical protein
MSRTLSTSTKNRRILIPPFKMYILLAFRRANYAVQEYCYPIEKNLTFNRENEIRPSYFTLVDRMPRLFKFIEERPGYCDIAALFLFLHIILNIKIPKPNLLSPQFPLQLGQ